MNNKSTVATDTPQTANGEPGEKSENDEAVNQPSPLPIQVIGAFMLGGLVVTALFSLNTTESLTVFSIGALLAGASATIGGLLGFLFGIPRALSNGTVFVQPSHAETDSAKAQGERRASYGANTNLEQISDWLTKILVGVGLTQLNDAPTKLQSLASVVSRGFVNVANADVLAMAIILYFLVCGFLFGYLWTRLFLPRDLRIADIGGLGQQLNQIKKQVSALEEQASRDAKALSVVRTQLNPDAPEVSDKELKSALEAASPSVKTTVFYQAWDVRSSNWKENETKPKMERTIPVFRALIACETRGKHYHTNHGQLGFALKDKQNPDWKGAKEALTKAIDFRGDWKTQGWIYYEFNRGICEIMLDEQFRKKEPSTQESRERILADLKAAARFVDLRNKLNADERVTEWREINNVPPF